MYVLGLPVPEYMLPFQMELGAAHMTFEDMQTLVSVNRARPLFPNQWKDSNPVRSSLMHEFNSCLFELLGL